MHSDESYVLRALKAGARGYLLKDSAEADLIKAVRAVHEGRNSFSPAISRMLLEDYIRQLQQRGGEDSYDLLSSREREVLLMHEVHGVPLQEVALALGIPPTEAEGFLASARRRVRAAEKAPTDEQALQKCRSAG